MKSQRAAVSTPHALAAEAFHIGARAEGADDPILYNAENGALLYDADGSGSGDAVRFAKLAPELTELSHLDFLVA